jgi:hypothetical protein
VFGTRAGSFDCIACWNTYRHYLLIDQTTNSLTYPFERTKVVALVKMTPMTVESSEVVISTFPAAEEVNKY